MGEPTSYWSHRLLVYNYVKLASAFIVILPELYIVKLNLVLGC